MQTSLPESETPKCALPSVSPEGRLPCQPPASTTSWMSRQSPEAPGVQAQQSLFLYSPWQISRANEDTTDHDLTRSSATGHLLVQNTGNKSNEWVFLTFSYREENQLVMYPTLFSLVSSFRAEGNFFSARSTYWLLTFSGCFRMAGLTGSLNGG